MNTQDRPKHCPLKALAKCGAPSVTFLPAQKPVYEREATGTLICSGLVYEN